MRRLVAAFALIAALMGRSTIAVRAETNACWQFVYSAVEHSAAQPRAPYVSYSLAGDIVQDGQLLEHETAQITYRDDGLASIDDNRWVYPFFSRVLEPGPPVLGPYSGRRESWLGLDATGPYPIIASVQTHERKRCERIGEDVVDGARTVHVIFPDASTQVPALKAVWIDPSTLDFKRIVVSEWVNFWLPASGNRNRALANYTVDMMHVGKYAVLHSVYWTYARQVYSQRSILSASYTFGGYAFTSAPPPDSLFAMHR
jgi:hypothetical protein